VLNLKPNVLVLFLAVRAPKQFSVMGDDTANTTVTSADEFVWIDSYNRLVELQVNYLLAFGLHNEAILKN
jgi:hypothetical protein